VPTHDPPFATRNHALTALITAHLRVKVQRSSCTVVRLHQTAIGVPCLATPPGLHHRAAGVAVVRGVGKHAAVAIHQPCRTHVDLRPAAVVVGSTARVPGGVVVRLTTRGVLGAPISDWGIEVGAETANPDMEVAAASGTFLVDDAAVADIASHGPVYARPLASVRDDIEGGRELVRPIWELVRGLEPLRACRDPALSAADLRITVRIFRTCGKTPPFKTRRYVNVCPKPVLANSQPFLNLEIAQTKRAFRTDLARPIEAQPEELP
jgi:hypothetical protein